MEIVDINQIIEFTRESAEKDMAIGGWLADNAAVYTSVNGFRQVLRAFIIPQHVALHRKANTVLLSMATDMFMDGVHDLGRLVPRQIDGGHAQGG